MPLRNRKLTVMAGWGNALLARAVVRGARWSGLQWAFALRLDDGLPALEII